MFAVIEAQLQLNYYPSNKFQTGAFAFPETFSNNHRKISNGSPSLRSSYTTIAFSCDDDATRSMREKKKIMSLRKLFVFTVVERKKDRSRDEKEEITKGGAAREKIC